MDLVKFLSEYAEKSANYPQLELKAAADEIVMLRSKLDEVSKELAATKGGPISCEAHGWSGDDNCAYCRAEDAEGRLDKMSKHVLDLCEILRDKWTVDMEDSVIRISEYEAKTGLDWPPPELRVVERQCRTCGKTGVDIVHVCE